MIPEGHLDITSAQRVCRIALAEWQEVMNRIRDVVEEHQLYTPDAFEISIAGLLPEFKQATREAVAELQAFVQIKSGDEKFGQGEERNRG